MPIKPSLFKKLPKNVRLALSAHHDAVRAHEISRLAHQHAREASERRGNHPKKPGLPESDAHRFILRINQAEYRRSRASAKKAQLRANLIPNSKRKGGLLRNAKARALKDVQIEKRRSKALLKTRQKTRAMKL